MEFTKEQMSKALDEAYKKAGHNAYFADGFEAGVVFVQDQIKKGKLLPVQRTGRIHLRFCMRKAYESGAKNHPQKVMKELGIKYQHATPQSMGDQWSFWNCENTPKELPEYLEVADWNPMEMIGFGLSKEDAEAIRDYAK